MFVAFKDASEAKIIASFSCAQDVNVWPYQGTVLTTDSRWTAYSALFPSGTFTSVGG
ncbi:TPA: hypothetical protein QDC06_000215 [Burkholderia cepacia]|nr:hypothetical protein [Burkholderia cepacia]